MRVANLGSASGDFGTPQGPEARIIDGERVKSYKTTSTSPHYAFSWGECVLDERLANWLQEDIDLYEFESRSKAELLPTPRCSCMSMQKVMTCHIIGWGGCVIHRIQEFCWVFSFISDLAPKGKTEI